uniref:Ysc84 actin-binding domain-containing protein n=1 Tax=Chenopodium quinoa TaxID=63459 RepID=A0A803N2T8_CHEQI
MIIVTKQPKYFDYDATLVEETGEWIPISIPPMSEIEHEEWMHGLPSNGGYYQEKDCWLDDDKDLTMWDVVAELLLAGREKVGSSASSGLQRFNFSCVSGHLLEFHPIMCSRHHCWFCGGVFYGDCTKGRSLLPARFHLPDPQRVCDVCWVRLESVKPYLMDRVSRAAQLPIHDVTDLSTLRSWLNFPWGDSMEHEIYKATNAIRGYCSKVGALKVEKAIPSVILKQAKGLAILTVVKVGVMMSYNIGTGLVVARREDGSWSPPSAMSSFGVSWGAQAGGELTDFIIVLRTADALNTFSASGHISVGAGMSGAIGTAGRTIGADVRAGIGGYSACYTYSCIKGNGAVVGASTPISVASI